MHCHFGTKKVYTNLCTQKSVYKQLVQDLLNCFSEFKCFPFDLVAPILRTFQSVVPGLHKLFADLKFAYGEGEAKLN